MLNKNSITPKLIWGDFLRIIKENVPTITFNTWFLPIKPIEINNSVLKIQVPNSFFIEWIDEHYNTLINNAVSKLLGEDGKLIYLVNESEESETPLFKDDSSQISRVKANNHIIENEDGHEYENYLNPRYNFENFIKGEGNQLARAAAYAISENPGKTTFNPLFLYGGVGLGKTHLMHAVGNKVIQNFPDKKTIYLSSDIFTVQFVESIQNNKINEFSALYNSMDVLIIDDIQFLIGKEKTQDFFFHLFNNLHQSGKQIILSSDKPPKDLKGLNERLISRFQWGLTADIQPPDFETRIAILKNKSKSYGIELSNEIIEFIAHNITSNIRELEGCLIKLLANASLNSKEIDFELTKKTVKEIATGRQVDISIDFITKVVCEYYKVDENKVREKNRKKEIVIARQVAMYLSKKMTRSSLKTIGLHFGGRDHSTVIHAYNNIERIMGDDLQTRDSIDSIRNKIEMSVA
ncbi:MAG: chromosomal replication initiator protein DnaA [Ignavibacteria bacterium]